MVNCINVKEYCKITFFSHSFTCLIFTCPWVPQWLCISWYLPISIFSTIPCHFILSRYLITCICPDFASPANLRKIWPGFYFCFYILYFKNISFCFLVFRSFLVTICLKYIHIVYVLFFIAVY